MSLEVKIGRLFFRDCEALFTLLADRLRREYLSTGMRAQFQTAFDLSIFPHVIPHLCGTLFMV